MKKKKKTYRLVYFAFLADHRLKSNESKKKDNYKDFARELKKLCLMEVTIIVGVLGTVTKGFDKRLKRKIVTIVKIGYNTEKRPGDMKRFTVTQTPVKDHLLTLVRKTHEECNDKRDNDNVRPIYSTTFIYNQS